MTEDDRLPTALRDTLHDPARALLVPDDPVRWVHRGVRRQRTHRGLALLTLVALLSAGGLVTRTVGRDHQTQQLAAEPAQAAVPRPASYLVHLQDRTGVPGAIQEIDAATGRALRTLGQAYDPYLMDGFAVDPSHQHLYYTTLNEPAQTIDVVDQPVNGGPSVVLGHGSQLRLSPNGRWLAYLTTTALTASLAVQPARVTVRDLVTGRQRTVALALTSPPQRAQSAQLVWLADSRLLLLQRPLSIGNIARSCPATEACPAVAPVDQTTHLFRLDPRSSHPTWTSVAGVGHANRTDPGQAPVAWQTYDLLAPATSADQVRVVLDGSASSHVLTVRLQDGAPTDVLALPAGAQPQGFDASGQHLLISTPSLPTVPSAALPEGTYTLDADGQPHRLGPAGAETAW